MSWDNEDLQKYFRNLLQAFEERNGIESQQILRTRRGEMARTGAISGVHLARMATEFAGKTLYEPAMHMLDAFDEASQALNMRPTEDDYLSLQAQVEQRINRSEPGVSSRIQSEYRLIAQMEAPNQISQQVAGNAVRELRRRIERRILEARHAVPSSDNRGGLAFLTALHDLNRAARVRIGFSLFQTSEYQATQDIVKTPRSSEELAIGLQLLGLLLDQTNEDKVMKALDGTGVEAPDGALNRIEALLKVLKVTYPEGALSRLRDVRRLANGYPRHADGVQTLEAATRLGVDARTNESRSWDVITEAAITALRDIARALRK